MKVLNTDYLSGWYIGSFEPSLVSSNEIEVGTKLVPSGTLPDYHYHKIKREITVVLSGSIKLESSGEIVSSGSAIILEPFEKNDQIFLEDTLILIINTPSAQSDKHY